MDFEISEQFQMCNAIPILSPFFLYHPYISQKIIQIIIRSIFYFLVMQIQPNGNLFPEAIFTAC